MIPARSFRGKRVALFGLGGSGIATARALIEGGAEVLAWDDNPESVAKAAASGIATGDLRAADWPSFASFVLSPGVPLTHPKPHWTVELARGAGVEIIGDIELLRARTHGRSARRAVRGDHRDQRQVDDDRADRPHPEGGRPRHPGRRQYRPRGDDARSARRRTASTSSSARPTRSTLRPRSTRPPACCST